MAHTLACLRFAGLVAETVARLTTGLDGICTRWTTIRNFMESSQVLQSQSTSRAWSHCLAYSPISRFQKAFRVIFKRKRAPLNYGPSESAARGWP
jgi:hypothetical protein